MYFALFYDYVPGILERRGPFRPRHLELARAYQERGELLLAGAWGDPADGALFIFHANSPGVVEGFVKADPYVQNGLVTTHHIRHWNVVIGGKDG